MHTKDNKLEQLLTQQVLALFTQCTSLQIALYMYDQSQGLDTSLIAWESEAENQTVNTL